jgi:hypothetical protein
MAKLTTAIPLQAFELIRDRIWSILVLEMQSLFLITNDSIYQNNLFLERSVTSFDKTELPAINISFAGGKLSEKAMISEIAVYTYNIDVYVSENSTDTDSLADTKSALKLQRILGLCRNILGSSFYFRLAFINNFVHWVHNDSISIAEPNRSDLGSIMMGRLVVSVKATEISENAIPKTLNDSETLIKLENTNLGYFWSVKTSEDFNEDFNLEDFS